MFYDIIRSALDFISSTEYSVWYKLGYFMSPLLVIPATWGILDQAYTNYKNQSADALSVHAVMYKFVVYIIATYYATALSFPTVRIVIDYLFIIEFGILAFQKYYYDRRPVIRNYVHGVMLGVVLGGLVIGYFSPVYYLEIGHAFGWLILAMNVVGRVPQLVHNWRRGSVRGYSWRYMLLGHISGWLNLFCAFSLNLALQTKLLMIYSVAVSIVLLSQYLYYDAKDRLKKGSL